MRYPNRFPWDLAPLLAEHPKVLPYLDIPVQHAATPVLRAMRRAGAVIRSAGRWTGYTRGPDLTLRTTVLLGFPGETDQDVGVVDLVRDFGLSRVGAFTYSPEEGTPGFGLGGSVPVDVAMSRRDAVLAERDAQLSRTQSEAIETEVEVLVDEPPDPDGGVIVGHRCMTHPRWTWSPSQGRPRPLWATGSACASRPRMGAQLDRHPGGRRSSMTAADGVFAHWPNRITMIRFVGSLALFAIFAIWGDVDAAAIEQDRAPFFVAFWLFVVVAATDYLDGYLAEDQIITAFGRIADPFRTRC